MIVQTVVLYLLEIFGLFLLELNHLKFNIDRGVIDHERFKHLLNRHWSPLQLFLGDYEEYRALNDGWGRFGIRYTPIIIVAIPYLGAITALSRSSPDNILIHFLGTVVMTLTLLESLVFIWNSYR